MSRTLPALAFLMIAGCTNATSPARSEDPTLDAVDAKEDVAASNIAPKLQPLIAFLGDDKNLVKQLGPEGTEAQNVKKNLRVVRYTEFGKAVDVAARNVARNYQVDLSGGKYRRAYGLVDLISVGDMYVQVKTGYGDDSFVDKLVASSKRSQARDLTSTLLPEAALLTADHASTTSTGNYVLVLGDLASGQAIVLTITYEVY